MVSAIFQNKVIEDFSGQVSQLETLEGLRDLFSGSIRNLGLRLFTYLIIPLPIEEDHPVPFFITSYPQSWCVRYESAGYQFDDPIIDEGQKATAPFIWSGEEPRWAQSTRQKLMFHEAAEHGLCHGLTIPLFSRGGRFALLTVADNRPLHMFKARMAAHQNTLHLLAIHFHEAVLIVTQPKDRRFKRRVLTQRELECLFWTARGKTTWEIAQILGITNNTFNFHIRNVTRKMGVYSKHHAVVKAIGMGLFDPVDDEASFKASHTT